VGDDGGVVPAARRIITPAKFGPVGFTHDNDTDVSVTLVACKEVTGPGGEAAVRWATGLSPGRGAGVRSDEGGGGDGVRPAVVGRLVPGLASVATRTPDVGDDGGVVPAARRIITPAKFGPVGFTHDNDTDVSVTFVACKEVTGPGGEAAFRWVTGLSPTRVAGLSIAPPRIAVAPRVAPRTCACPGVAEDTATARSTVVGTRTADHVTPRSLVTAMPARPLGSSPTAT